MTLKYVRYLVPNESEHEDLHEAMVVAHYGVDHNEFCPTEIIADGIVYDEDKMREYWDEHNVGI